MTVYEDGYYCHICDKTVKAKIWWSNKENDLVASCTICGTELQRVIPTPASKLNWPKGYIETVGRPGLEDAESKSPNIPAPAKPTTEDTT